MPWIGSTSSRNQGSRESTRCSPDKLQYWKAAMGGGRLPSPAELSTRRGVVPNGGAAGPEENGKQRRAGRSSAETQRFPAWLTEPTAANGHSSSGPLPRGCSTLATTVGG